MQAELLAVLYVPSLQGAQRADSLSCSAENPLRQRHIESLELPIFDDEFNGHETQVACDVWATPNENLPRAHRSQALGP